MRRTGGYGDRDKKKSDYSRTATTSFLEMLWPSFTFKSLITPSLGDFMATCIFMDSNTTILSPFFTESPLLIETDMILPGIWLEIEFWEDCPPPPRPAEF